MTSSKHRWWQTFGPRSRARLTLVCFPYAGGHAAVFRSWPHQLAEWIEVYGIQLPGRRNRVDETPRTSLPFLVDEIGRALSPALDKPFACFGHSVGAILAFEVSRWLRRERGTEPRHLIVSGRRAPQAPASETIIHDKSDAVVLDKLRELKGTPPEILADAELLQTMLPTLRADFSLSERYTYVHEPALGCPITAFGGREDEETAHGRLEMWRTQTTAAFVSHMFDGGHFFVHEHEGELVRRVDEALSSAADTDGQNADAARSFVRPSAHSPSTRS